MTRIAQLIEQFSLLPHPEGGYFRENYRSSGEIKSTSLDSNYKGSRNYSTAIYFLLSSDTFSAFHKINQDEIWHFYEGSPIRLFTISEKGELAEHLIGSDFNKGQLPQLVVPGNHWFAAEILDPNSYAFVGCTVAPGFDFADFELADRKLLSEEFPQHSGLIHRLTRIDA